PSAPAAAQPMPPGVQSAPAVQSASAAMQPMPPDAPSAPAVAQPTPPSAWPSPPPTAEFAPGIRRKPRRSPWALGAAVGLLVAAAAVGLVLWLPGHAGGTPGQHHHHYASPQAVARAYISDINHRRYRAAWRLGGDNIDRSYQQFVDGYQRT